jgi:mono/diheme cytochrome c family protein
MAPTGSCSTLRTLYVKNFSERSITAIDVAGYMHDGSLNPASQSISTVTDEVLSADELNGLQQFYHSRIPEMGPEGYISCASCHTDGSHDGRTWDMTAMGEGFRNTISLNGASGTRFGNLHWSSNFDEVQDFEIQIEHLNGGTGLIEGRTFTDDRSPLDVTTSGLSEDLDALAAYVNGLGKDSVQRSPHRTYTGELTESANRGQQLFEDQGCATCHTGAAFRDGRSHDVGTLSYTSGSRLGGALDAIRTPTLIELWDSAPYFHDGSAATLGEVLSTGDHAVNLDASQRDDLIEFLLSIDRDMYIDD